MTSLAATAAAKLSNGLGGHHSNGSALPGGGSHQQNGDLEYMEKMDAGLDEKRTGGKASNVGGLPRGGGGGDTSKRARDSSKLATKEDQVAKLELDLKKLKVDLQVARNKENELRDQIVSSAASKSFKILVCFLFICVMNNSSYIFCVGFKYHLENRLERSREHKS